MINTMLNEGLRGMQVSAKEMQKSAHDIAQLNVRQESAVGAQNAEDRAIPPVDKPSEPAKLGNIAEPIVELKRQELVFTASAQIVKTADDTLGSILDISS